MKRIIYAIFSFALVSLIPAMAQTQQGYVKTKGRMVNGQLQRGKFLGGAVIQVKERLAVVSQDNGTFSFPVPAKTYLLQSVKKNGYQLVDMEVCRNYQYSVDPLYLVMESPEQQQADLLASERKIRRNLQRQLQQREEEIETLQASQQVKDSLLRILYQQQGDNEKLIADMAKRYSTLDYDQLDDFYRKVTYFIENGELTRADSMLRSRGDVNAQVASQLRKGQAIQEQKEQIQKAEAVHVADNEELARRCYAYYESFQQQHMVDSAAHYLELRAALDTTNVEWQNEAGLYIEHMLGDYARAIVCYQSVLRHSLNQYGEESKRTAKAYNRIGFVYYHQDDYVKALEYHQKALSIFERVFGAEHPDVARSYNYIGVVYSSQGDYVKALEYYQKYLSISEKVLGAENLDVVTSYIDIGSVYYHQDDYVKALEYYQKASAICEKVLGAKQYYTKYIKK